MANYEVWKTSIVKEMVEIEANTLEEALEEVVENSNEFDFAFMDADSTYEAFPIEEDN
jgi:hypothetical protein